MRFVVLFFHIFKYVSVFICLLLDVNGSVHFVSVCWMFAFELIKHLKNAWSSFCYIWNTQHVTHVRRHTIFVHRLCTQDVQYTWPTVTHLELYVQRLSC